MRFFFARHGESEANLLRVFSNRGWKHPLTATGREQMEGLARKLRNRGVGAIYTSPLRRAVESAEVLGACLSLRYEIEPALIEYDVGAYEDRSDAEAWQASAGLEQRWIEGDRDARMPGGESCNDIRNRFRPFIARVMDRFKASGSVVHLDSATGRPVGNPGLFDVAVVLIGHSGTYTQALPEVLDNVSPGFAVTHSLAHTAYVEAALRPDGLHCLRWGDELFG